MNAPVESPEIGREINAAGYSTNLHDLGEGFPVMMIHGSGPGVTAWANWRLVMPELARNRRVIAPDTLGFAYTEPPAVHTCSPERLVTPEFVLIAELGLE